MAKVKLKLDAPKQLSEITSDKLSREVGKVAIPLIKKLCLSGQSPVEGRGRFQRYKDTSNYPGRIIALDEYPGKTKSPVNLFLSGKMLDAIEAFRSGKAIRLGIFNDNEALDRAIAHNEGKGKMPRRAFLPTKDGEKFAQTIMRAIVDIFDKRVKELLTRK